MVQPDWLRKLTNSWMHSPGWRWGGKPSARRAGGRPATLNLERLEDRFAPTANLVRSIDSQSSTSASNPSDLAATDVSHGRESGAFANSAPVLDAGAKPTLAVVSPSATDSLAGGTVAGLLGSSITDADSGSLQGMAIVGLEGVGTWQYSRKGGSTWLDFGSVSASAVRLLTPTDRVRFLPGTGYTGGGTLTFRAWDQTSGTAGGIADLSAAGSRGGNTAYSTATVKAAVAEGSVVLRGSTLAFTGTSGADTFSYDVNATTNHVTLDGVAYAALVSLVSAFSFDGGAGNDSVVGPNATNIWDVAGGTLDGNVHFSHVETLVGGSRKDTYAFGTNTPLGSVGIVDTAGGTDTLDFSRSTTLGVTANLTLGGFQTVNANLKLALHYNNSIENVVGTSLADRLTGNGLNNQFAGGAGNDTYAFDTDTQQGSDTIVENTGGTDTLDFSGTTTQNVAIDLSQATAQVVNSNLTLTLSSGSTIENAVGGALNDTLTGNVLVNTLSGGAGNDTLSGGGGTDVLRGGDGNDTFPIGVAGANTTIDGGNGTDTVSAANLPATWAVTTWKLTAAHAGVVNGTQFSNVENLVGGTGTDTVVGPTATASHWVVSGTSAGSLTGGVSFTNMENLTGGTTNDVFSSSTGSLIAGPHAAGVVTLWLTAAPAGGRLISARI